MFLRLATIAAIGSLLYAGSYLSVGAVTDPDKYVRTANYYLLSGTNLEQTSTIETLAKFDLLVLPAEAQVYNKTFFTTVRRKNPDIVILAYVPTVSYNSIWTDSLHRDLKAGITPIMWLENSDGGDVSIWPGTTALNLNSSWNTYLAEFVDTKVLGTGLWDGVFYDEVGDSISWVGDVDTDRDGTADAAATADANWRAGYVTLYKQTRALVGDDAIIITNGSSRSEYWPYVNGRMFESFPTPWEGDGSWASVMNSYARVEDGSLERPDTIVVLNGNTDNTGNRTDYRRMRFGLASTLLGGGYFGFDYGTERHADTWYYDEYDVFLGAPKEEPTDLLHGSASFVPSVWERDFDEGKVLVNSTNETQTIKLDGEYEKIHGSQDTTTNNGAIVSRVTLAPNDGIILLRPIEELDNAVFKNGSFIRIFNGDGSTKRTGFFTYTSAFKGGTNVITYNLDADPAIETVGANDSTITILDDNGTVLKTFYPYDATYHLGINLAIGDLDGDGRVEIVTGTENGGGPHIRIFDQSGSLIHPGWFAYGPEFRGGVNVALADLDGDGTDEILAGAGVSGGPHVRVFNRDGRLLNPGFFAYDPLFRGGVNVAGGDIDGNGTDEIVVGPGRGGGPHVRVFDASGTLISQFYAFDETGTDGVEVSAVDLDGDGRDEIIGIGSEVFTLSLF